MNEIWVVHQPFLMGSGVPFMSNCERSFELTLKSSVRHGQVTVAKYKVAGPTVVKDGRVSYVTITEAAG